MDADSPIDLRGIAKLLGVSPNTPNQWRQRGVLPDPDPEFADLARPAWKKSTIIKWARDTGRWPPGSIGRPEEWRPRQKKTVPAAKSVKKVRAKKAVKPAKKKTGGFVTAEDKLAEVPALIFQPPVMDAVA